MAHHLHSTDDCQYCNKLVNNRIDAILSSLAAAAEQYADQLTKDEARDGAEKFGSWENSYAAASRNALRGVNLAITLVKLHRPYDLDEDDTDTE